MPSTLARVLTDLPSVPVSIGGFAAVAPMTPDDAATLLRAAASVHAPVTFVGTGSSARFEELDRPVVEMSTANLVDVIDWQVEDLTITVGAGMRVGALEALLASRNQTSLLPTGNPDRTVGGLVAEGASGFGRLRYGPTRDRVLEVTLATGYGRVVRGGGRLVKNVTGYDLPRLVTGSMGSLGFVSSVCLKLWPLPRSLRTFAIENPSSALADLYRPFAVLETDRGAVSMLEGSEADVERQSSLIGGVPFDGGLPGPIGTPVVLSVRVPPRAVAQAVAVVKTAGAERWTAQHGVGVIDAGFGRFDDNELADLRAVVAEHGGIVVIVRPGADLAAAERWGSQPHGATIQRRMADQFDPAGICNPGVLPGSG